MTRKPLTPAKQFLLIALSAACAAALPARTNARGAAAAPQRTAATTATQQRGGAQRTPAPTPGAVGLPEITMSEQRVAPESLTSTADGAIIFGSTAAGKGSIYRAAPGATQATPWIDAAKYGLTNVLGVLADDKAGLLWACSNQTGGRNGAPVAGQTALRNFDLKTGEQKGVYEFPLLDPASPAGPQNQRGFSNDVAIGPDGSAYVSDTSLGRILRLKKGAEKLDAWLTDPLLRGVDGLTFLADGQLYLNNVNNGKFYRATVKPDGTPGPLTELKTSIPLKSPDGLRTAAGTDWMFQAESGRLTELKVTGDTVQVTVLREGLGATTAVTILGDKAWTLLGRQRAVAVPVTALEWIRDKE